MNKSNNNLWDEMKSFVYDSWGELQAEFDIDGGINIVDTRQLLIDTLSDLPIKIDIDKDFISNLPKLPTMVDIDISDAISAKLQYSNRLGFTDPIIIGTCGSGLPPEVTSLVVYINSEYLAYHIINSIHDINGCKQKIYKILRHEMGHVIFYLTLSERFTTYDEFFEYNKASKESLQKLKAIKDQLSCEDYTRAYYSIPNEKIANDLVGLTIDDLVECDYLYI